MRAKVILPLLLIILAGCNLEFEIPYIHDLAHGIAYDEENYKLRDILDDFVEDAAKYDVDLSYVYDEDIVMRFTDDISNGFATNARSYGLGKKGIFIFIKWQDIYRDTIPVHTRVVVYHELGHDVLNLKHTSGPRIMKQSLFRNIFTEEEFEASKEELFRH